MLIRRIAFSALAAATTLAVLLLAVMCLAPGGWSVMKLLMLLCFAVIAPWLGVCVGNTVPGLVLLLTARDPARFVLPITGEIDGPIIGRTAVLVTIRNEDIARLLPPLQRLRDRLDPALFTLCLLSDTQDPALARAEAHAAAADPALRYRRRAENSGFKAGNVMEFLDHHADDFDYAVMLDADSEMSAEAVCRLVRILEADSRMGIVQHLVVGRPAPSAFPRLFQFGMRAGMRIWAVGQGWWQGDQGPYWGHNAAFRIAPFRTHARLAPLPNGQTILSHDQVEAALLCGAGWKVCVWPVEAGSMEANPPALPEFLHRDSRWLAGNLQYIHLIGLPGFRPMGRFQLAQAMLMFAGAPCYAALPVLAAAELALNGLAAPAGPVAALMAALLLTLYCPKLAGYTQVVLQPDEARRYGGRRRFALGAALEVIFMLLLDGLSQPSKSFAMIRLACGARAGWLPQNRADRGVNWGEAARLFWAHTLLGLATTLVLAAVSPIAALTALPWTAGPLLAIPFCVLTSQPALSRLLQRQQIAATPEELSPSSQ